jgi:raffinose/stachyose/melibiose transport system permease protein
MKTKKIFTAFILIIVALLQIFPLIWLFSYSIKTSGDVFGPQLLSFTAHPHWENYRKAFVDGKIGLYFFNTIRVIIPSVLLATIIPFCMAYACTRMDWKLKKVVWFIIVIGLTIPIHTTLLPNFIWFKAFGLIDSRIGLIIAYTAFSISFNAIIFAGLLHSIPKSMEESAFLDGAGYFTVLSQIIAPMSITGFATTGIQTFLSHWNEFIMANTYISSEAKRTLPFSIIRFQGQYSADYAAQFACMLLVALPPLILYFAFNKWILAGVGAGAVKG